MEKDELFKTVVGEGLSEEVTLKPRLEGMKSSAMQRVGKEHSGQGNSICKILEVGKEARS